MEEIIALKDSMAHSFLYIESHGIYEHLSHHKIFRIQEQQWIKYVKPKMSYDNATHVCMTFNLYYI